MLGIARIVATDGVEFVANALVVGGHCPDLEGKRNVLDPIDLGQLVAKLVELALELLHGRGRPCA